MGFEKYRELLAAHGVRHRGALLVLYAMGEFGYSYENALNAYAEFRGVAPEPLHSDICFQMLGAGVETPAPRWFAQLVKELEDKEYEDGLYAAEGD